MKNKKSLFIILAVLLMGLLGWWLWRRNVPVPAPLSAKSSSVKTQNAKTTGTASSPTPVPGTTLPSIGQSIGQNPVTGQTEVKINPALPDTDKMQMILSAQNGRQIDIYGKVVDQYGVPVAGAKIRGNIATLSFDGSPNPDVFTETDGSGLFKFNDLHGANFGVALTKDGYAPYVGNNWSKDYQPDPANPMVFTMYKLQGAEPMVYTKIHDYVPCDGTEVHYDLLTGKKVATGGDLVVKLTRNPVDIVRGKPFDWEISMQVESGGLIEVHDPYPYQAPAEGYAPSLVILHKAGDKDWTSRLNSSYYVKAQGGKVYARVTVSVFADYQPPPTAFDVGIYANPSSSRNLEYDATKVAKPPFP